MVSTLLSVPFWVPIISTGAVVVAAAETLTHRCCLTRNAGRRKTAGCTRVLDVEGADPYEREMSHAPRSGGAICVGVRRCRSAREDVCTLTSLPGAFTPIRQLERPKASMISCSVALWVPKDVRMSSLATPTAYPRGKWMMSSIFHANYIPGCMHCLLTCNVCRTCRCKMSCQAAPEDRCAWHPTCPHRQKRARV